MAELHEGVTVWLHWKADSLPLYGTVSEMEPETAKIFLHLVMQEKRFLPIQRETS